MMEKIDELIEGLDEYIKKYSETFATSKASLVKDFKITTNCAIERTMAIVANSYIREYLSKYSQLYFHADEIQIRFDTISRNIDKFKKEVGDEVDKEYWSNCYVDGYFEYAYNKMKINMFVEYKMESKFTFVKLATDFLKYKLYTQHNGADSIFAYIVFDKKETYPSIIDPNLNKYIFLDEYISKDLPLSKCYFFMNNGEISELIPSVENTFQLRNSLDYLEKISNECDKLEEFDGFDMYNDFQKIFIDSISKFNTNVFDANILKENYNYLLEVYDVAIEENIFSGFEKIINFEHDNFKADVLRDFVEESCKYKDNMINKLVEEEKYEAVTKGFNVGTRISLFIVMLIDYFVKKHGLSLNTHSNFYDEGVKVNGKMKKIDVKEHIEPVVFDKIKERYSKKELSDKFDGHIFGVLYFLKNTYPLVYHIDENNKVISISKTKKILKIIENIQSNVKNLKKIYRNIGKVSIENYEQDINKICREIINDLHRNGKGE